MLRKILERLLLISAFMAGFLMSMSFVNAESLSEAQAIYKVELAECDIRTQNAFDKLDEEFQSCLASAVSSVFPGYIAAKHCSTTFKVSSESITSQRNSCRKAAKAEFTSARIRHMTQSDLARGDEIVKRSFPFGIPR